MNTTAAPIATTTNINIELIEPTTGKLFFENKQELIFCKPHLMPLKSQALERLEEMQRETARQLQEKRLKQNTKKDRKLEGTGAAPAAAAADITNKLNLFSSN